MTIVYLVVGGALGTTLRYYTSMGVANLTGAPALGTFAVNILGSFLIGLLLVLGTERYAWPSGATIFVGVGLLGGFTTFSALTWQTLQQLERGDMGAAVANIALSVACGLVAVWLGSTTARSLA